MEAIALTTIPTLDMLDTCLTNLLHQNYQETALLLSLLQISLQVTITASDVEPCRDLAKEPLYKRRQPLVLSSGNIGKVAIQRRSMVIGEQNRRLQV